MSRRKKQQVAEEQNMQEQGKTVQPKMFREVKPKTEGQARYIETIRNNTITLCYGPAGTGKSVIPCGLAVEALRRGQVERIILSRPLVEACGEEVGLLPGDITAKTDPFLVHLYDALEMFASTTEIKGWFEKKIVQVIPCAYLRGRTLKNSFIIIDECQNLSFKQIELILTRLGEESILVMNGDLLQSDLNHWDSGSFEEYIQRIMPDLTSVGIVELTEKDIVRHKLLAEIIRRIQQYKKAKALEKKAPVRGY